MIFTETKNRYTDREISWLSFNERVLQEAADENVPLLDRLRFLGIFSNNLDEFFRVRYASVRRLTQTKEGKNKLISGMTAQELLKRITDIVIHSQNKSLHILSEIEQKLEDENIYILNEFEINTEQKDFIKEFFINEVSSDLVTIILNDLAEFPLLRDSHGYLAVKLVLHATDPSKPERKRVRYALIELPNHINRFVVLPEKDGKQYVMLIDDIIRFNLNQIFSIFDIDTVSAHMIKVTRDAELDFDSDLHKSFLEKISTSVKDRRIGEVVRFVYDDQMDKDTLQFFLDKMHIEAVDSIIPGGRYHNRRDYMKFPKLGRNDLLSKPMYPLKVNGLSLEGSIIQQLKDKDFLIHTPYQSFNYIVRFLREAALDPKVTNIKITLYRLAKNSQIISSLINAAKNGKKVTVQIELQARFDETSNIFYAELMQTEGLHLIFGVKGLKVHSKICVVERLENKKIKRYGLISTGNFNESTATIYTDVTLLTAHQKILKETSKVFDFFEVSYKIQRYKHLIVSPHYMRNKFYKLIDREIENALNGLPACIWLKMNSLSDYKMIDRLYDASRAGVQIKLIIRGICCLIPGIPGMSENIEAISIVDNLLEHSRIYIFGNNEQPEVFISSADFMTRNIDERVEVTCPIYDENIKQELIDTFTICWNGNVKVRLHNEKLTNQYREDGRKAFRAQLEIYNYYRNKIEVIL